MNTVPCPRCATPVQHEKFFGHALAYERRIDQPDQRFAGVQWVVHSEDRCRSAELIAASGFDEEDGG
jgi:hypothetical protein